jgi:predicted ester cyclase
MAETATATRAIDEEQVRALFERFNDREAFFAHPEATWIDRPRYRVFAQDLEMNRRDDVVAWFRGFFDAVPDLHMKVEDVVIAGEPGRERVTVQWHITGTFSGKPYMSIEPTGRPIDLRGMDLIQVEDGRVAGNNIYYDQLAFARQIGMLPPEGSIGDRLMTGAFNLVTKSRAKVRARSRR